MKNSKPAYFIFNVLVHDPEEMKPYQERVADTFLPYGGDLLVLNDDVHKIEGADDLDGFVVVLQFPDISNARAWYASPEYQEILTYRQAASTARGWLVEGFFKR